MASKLIYKISEELGPDQEQAPPPSTPSPEQQLYLPFAQPAKCAEQSCPNYIQVQDRRISDPNTGAVYCMDHAQQCNSCNQVFYEGNMHEHDGNWYCAKDFANYFAECPNCHETVPKSNILPPTQNSWSMKNGGCTECAVKCCNCSRLVNKDDAREEEGDYWCEDCHSDNFRLCDGCGNTFSPDDMNYVEDASEDLCDRCFRKNYTNCEECNEVISKHDSYTHDGDSYCESCYSDKFFTCEKCNDTTPIDESERGPDDNMYCNYCWKEKFAHCYADDCDEVVDKDEASEFEGHYYCQEHYSEIASKIYGQYTDKFSEFSYTKKDRLLEPLYKLLPISVKDLKTKHPSLASGLGDLISFSKGKTLTLDLLKEYRETLKPEEYPVDYTVWEGVQRSIDNLPKEQRIKGPQLVMNIIASPELLGRLKANPAMYELFDSINTISKESTHPYIKDQIGWARLELDPNGEFILVDEIQCDHSNASYQLKTSQDRSRVMAAGQRLKEKHNWIGERPSDANQNVMDLIVDPDAQNDKDVQIIREVLKRKHQRNDEQLDKGLKAAKLLPALEAKLEEKFNKGMKVLLRTDELQDDEDIKLLREYYKAIGNLTDEQLKEKIWSNEPFQKILGLPDSSDDIKNIRNGLKQKYQLDDAGLDKLLSDYASVLSDFPNIATQAISRFARNNGFKKLFWHTYESGMKLKSNEPPRSLYEKTPKENQFQPTEDRPFGLEGKFFEREAKARQNLFKFARKMALKYLSSMS